MSALIKGLKDGTIDAIVTQHTPHEVEFKDVEFEVAEFGIIALQTAFAVALQAGLDLELIVQKLAVNPRRILNIEAAIIAEGKKAELTLLDTDATWEYTKQNNRSKSYNSPFIGQNLKGKALLVCNNNHLYKS